MERPHEETWFLLQINDFGRQKQLTTYTAKMTAVFSVGPTLFLYDNKWPSFLGLAWSTTTLPQRQTRRVFCASPGTPLLPSSV
jgi:hypothetical protein